MMTWSACQLPSPVSLCAAGSRGGEVLGGDPASFSKVCSLPSIRFMFSASSFSLCLDSLLIFSSSSAIALCAEALVRVVEHSCHAVGKCARLVVHPVLDGLPSSSPPRVCDQAGSSCWNSPSLSTIMTLSNSSLRPFFAVVGTSPSLCRR